jgi:outer membrane biosynthesis protein TonB
LHKQKAKLGEAVRARGEAIVVPAVGFLRKQYSAIASRAALFPARAEATMAPAVAFLRRQYREVATVTGVVILLVVVIATSSLARSGVDQRAVQPPLRESQPPAAAVPDVPKRQAAVTRRLPAAPSSLLGIPDRDAPESSEIAALRARALAQLSPRRNTSQSNARPADSEAAVVAAAGDFLPVRSELSTTNDPQPVGGVKRARLIGAMPVPRYPSWLSGVTAEVRVRFDVDTTGWPVMETFLVESSPDRVFTDAVRSVIRYMRFVPARAATPPFQAVVETVEMGFRLTPPR